jgi:hypothetical protein
VKTEHSTNALKPLKLPERILWKLQRLIFLVLKKEVDVEGFICAKFYDKVIIPGTKIRMPTGCLPYHTIDMLGV